VWFVPLATVTDPARVGLAVVEALRLTNPSGRASIEVVAERLCDWAALLVLDNFEHVAEVASWVGELLARAPGIRVLATSRVVLGLTGEHEYQVRPLPSEEAATLFVQRAQAVRPRFALDGNGTRATVTEICARLDGLPLAIELAAARLRLLSLEDLRRRLEDRLPCWPAAPVTCPSGSGPCAPPSTGATGHDGGQVVFSGTPAELVANGDTLTAQHLRAYLEEA
jgi:predicted ATPase